MQKKTDYKRIGVYVSVFSFTLGLIVCAIAYANSESKIVAAHCALPWHSEGGDILKEQSAKLSDIADRTMRIEIEQEYQAHSIEDGFEAIMEKLDVRG